MQYLLAVQHHDGAGDSRMRDVLLHIGGEWRRGGAGAADTFDPATEERIGRVALADAADLDAAIDAAARAFPAWRDGRAETVT